MKCSLPDNCKLRIYSDEQFAGFDYDGDPIFETVYWVALVFPNGKRWRHRSNYSTAQYSYPYRLANMLAAAVRRSRIVVLNEWSSVASV